MRRGAKTYRGSEIALTLKVFEPAVMVTTIGMSATPVTGIDVGAAICDELTLIDLLKSVLPRRSATETPIGPWDDPIPLRSSALRFGHQIAEGMVRDDVTGL